MIYVFKTSVETETGIRLLKPHLDKVFPFAKWNFDLEDCDNVLRIEIKSEIVQSIISLLNENGFECQELTD